MTPEKKLWLNVILKTVDDAKELRRKLHIAKFPQEIAFLSRERRILLEEVKSDWFHEICDYCDFSQDWVVEEMHKIFKE